MSNEEVSVKEVELKLEPIPPDTIDSIKEEFEPVFRQILQETGHENLLDDEQIEMEVEETFPTAEVVTVILTIATPMIVETFKVTILPEIKKRWTAWIEEREKKQKKNN